MVSVNLETERGLIERAQRAMSRASWELGECASLWLHRFGRGRTDRDFGVLVAVSELQVTQRRIVWDMFSAVYQDYRNLTWGHFFVALEWPDALACLRWADDVEANVAEMKAWRRAQRGEPLDEIASDLKTPLAGQKELF